jgi:ribosomal protein L6P/L9E
MYTEKNKIKLPFFGNNIFFDKETNTIRFGFGMFDYEWTKIINNFNKKLVDFNKNHFNKIKFKGKGFRLRFKKKNKTLKFMFGHSHINIFFLKNVKIKRLGKYKYLFKSKDVQKIKNIAMLICSVKPINLFTKRGIRKGRQVIFKRKGKKSSYV